MPFRRFTKSRRFSATPRRSWRRSPSSSMLPRLQQGAFSDNDSLIVTGDDLDFIPGVFVFDVTPWENAPPGGYDQKIMIKGILFQIHVWPIASSPDGNTFTNGPLRLTGVGGVAYHNVCGCLFVDDMAADGTPNSLSNVGIGQYGPFASIPPSADPATSTNVDRKIVPTKWLARKFGRVQATTAVVASPATTDREEFHVIGHASFRWSSRLRRRITIGSRQALLIGVFAGPEFSSSSTNEWELGVSITTNYYYKIIR